MKNKQKIKHLRVSTENGNDRYLCKWASVIIEGKWTWDESETNCKNCLKKLSKKKTYMQKRKFKVID